MEVAAADAAGSGLTKRKAAKVEAQGEALKVIVKDISSLRKKTLNIENAAEKQKKPEEMGELNVRRRGLHAQVEGVALRLAGLDELPEENVKAVQKDVDELRKSLKLHAKRQPMTVWRYIKLGAIMLYILITAVPLFALLPLRMLHPTLRKCGLQNNFLPLDTITRLYAAGFLRLMGIGIQVQGLENLDCANNSICMFTHASNLDPFVVGTASPVVFKWIGKKAVFFVPIFGQIAWGFGMIPINRGNLKSAIGSLDQAVKIVKRWKRSIAISPEGTRSKTGQIQPFKKGPFHLLKKCDLPASPAIIVGAFELWPPGQMFPSCGDVVLQFKPEINFKSTDTVESMQHRVRQVFLEENAIAPAPPAVRSERVLDVLFVLAQYAIAGTLLGWTVGLI